MLLLRGLCRRAAVVRKAPPTIRWSAIGKAQGRLPRGSCWGEPVCWPSRWSRSSPSCSCRGHGRARAPELRAKAAASGGAGTGRGVPARNSPEATIRSRGRRTPADAAVAFCGVVAWASKHRGVPESWRSGAGGAAGRPGFV